MNLKNCLILLNLFFIFCSADRAFTQSLNGKKIYLSTTDEITLRFHSNIQEASLVNKEAQSWIKIKRSTLTTTITVFAEKENFPNAIMKIIEGGNIHLFTLTYKEILTEPELLYDFSDLNKLKEMVSQMEKESKNPASSINSSNNSTGDSSHIAAPLKEPAGIPKNPQQDIDARYDKIILEANTAYNARKLYEALQLYKLADSIKASQPYCKSQITLIEIMIRRKEEDEANKAIELSYQSHILLAKDAMGKKDYTLAANEYNLALHDKPGDMDARSGLLQVDAARKNEEFNSYLKNANDYLSIGQFDKAAAVIDAALLIKNNDPGALLVKSNIQKAKEDFEKKQKEEQAKKEIEQRFSDTLLLAEQFFTSGMFEDSKQKFKKADQIKPGDSYVAKRLHAIDSIFTQRKNERQAAVQDSLNKINYNREIAKADKVFEAKDYKKAIESYKFAKSIRPAEKYPDEKISESEIILLQIEEEKKAETIKKEKEDSINKAYSNALKQGKASLVNKDYLQAFNFFSDAHTLKPQENEPAEKIIFVDSILRAIQNDNDYKKVLANAYDAMSAKDLKTALKWYDSALALKPLEEFPKARIIEINNTLRRNDSIAMMQKKKEMLTMNFEAALPVYKKADTARLELRNLDAYNGYTAFINKIDMESLGDYSTAQVSIIKNAMNYVSRLDAYKPRQANTPEELSEKYPGIDFSKAPPEQNFISPVSEDPKMKAFIAKQVLPKSNRAVAVNTLGKVQLYCRSIIFQDQKSIYFTFVIKNTDTSDYLTGPMFLQVAKKDGSSKQVLPKYISTFPLIPPHQEDTVVYVANWLILQNDEKLVFQLSDRTNSRKIILDINSTNYELERRNAY